MELQILDWIQKFRSPGLDFLMVQITRLGDKGMIWLVLAVILLIIPKTRKSGAVLTVALTIDVLLCNGILKHLFARIRPCDVNQTVQLLVPRPDDFSFPSGHTAASFCAVTALYLCREKILWKVSFVVAILIAFSRLYLYVHYPTDILGGILFGICAGALGGLLCHIYEQKRVQRKGEIYKCQL